MHISSVCGRPLRRYWMNSDNIISVCVSCASIIPSTSSTRSSIFGSALCFFLFLSETTVEVGTSLRGPDTESKAQGSG